MKRIISSFLFLMILLTGCTVKKSDETVNSGDISESAKFESEEVMNSDEEQVSKASDDTSNANDDDSKTKKSNNITKDKSVNKTRRGINSFFKQEKSSDSISAKNISEKVKEYIINNQENKPEAEKIKWSKSFLNQLDVGSLYRQYIESGGDSQDLKKFAEYITLNASVPSNWQELFEKELYDTYGEKVSKVEHLKDDLYQVYVKKDNKEVPYVVVSSRTGYYHG